MARTTHEKLISKHAHDKMRREERAARKRYQEARKRYCSIPERFQKTSHGWHTNADANATLDDALGARTDWLICRERALWWQDKIHAPGEPTKRREG